MKTNDKKHSTKIEWDIVHMQINSKNVALFQVNPNFFWEMFLCKRFDNCHI